jgi:TatD DNase family protein
MRAAVGVHPQNALQWNDESATELRALAASPNAAAIGEIGLDWVYDDTHAQYPGASRDHQKEVFATQLRLARELDLPVVVHNRDADDDVLEVLASVEDTRGVIHCWAGTVEAAQRALEMGLYLGFTGLVTFKNAESVREVVRLCPLAKLLIETDAPYLAPIPHRGKRNEPAFVPHTARAIAEIKTVSPQELADITRNNALRLFG